MTRIVSAQGNVPICSRSLWAFVAMLALVSCFSVRYFEPAQGGPLNGSDKWAWATLAWTGDDRPYAYAEARIDSEAAAGRAFGYFTSIYHGAAAAPTNALAQFADAYGAWRNIEQFRRNGGVQLNILQTADSELANTSDPPTYHFERLRFLIEADTLDPNPHLKALGQRLLSRDPKDLKVEYWLVRMLGNSTQDLELGMRCVDDLLREDSADANVSAMLRREVTTGSA